MSLKRVVVTGMGALSPIGNSVNEVRAALEEGTSGAGPITKFDTEKFKTKFACEVKNFDILDHMDKKEARKLDPVAQFAMVTAEEAVKDAGLESDGINKDRVGVIWGSGIGGIKSFEDEVSNYATGSGTPRFSPFFITKMIIDIIPGHISIKYGFRGPNFSTVSACATSGNALADAYNYIRLGKAEAFVVGGSEAAITEAGIGGFNAMKALSERNDSPETASRPFDKDRDGFVMGEGAASLVLEEYEHAKARGANIISEVKGAALSADAHHITAPHPEGQGVILAMNEVLADSGLSAADIDYINVHGTSTPLGDIAEIKAIREVFKDHIFDLNISSTKSMTGHLLGAAGAIEAVASVLAVRDNFIPPTINNFDRDEQVDEKIDLTLNKTQKKEVRNALSNTFGFGGHNTTILFGKISD